MRRILIDWNGNEAGKLYIFGKKGRSEYDLSGENTKRPNRISTFDRVYLNIPLDLINFRIMCLPFEDLEKIREVLPFELSSRILKSSQEIVSDAVILKKDGMNTEVLAAYMERAALDRGFAFARRNGFLPDFIISAGLRHFWENFAPDNLAQTGVLSTEELLDCFDKDCQGPLVEFSRNYVSPEKSGLGRYLRSTFSLAGMVSAAILVLIIYKWVTVRDQIATVQSAMKQSYSVFFPNDRTIIDPLYQAKVHVKALKGKESSCSFNPNDMLLNLTKISRTDIRINELTMDRNKLILRGESPGLEAVETFRKGLEQILTSARLDESKSFKSQIHFSLSGEVK